MKQEFKIIADNIENNTRVLDVGCGDGVLIEYLKKEKNVDVRGLEISKDKVQICISKGLTVIEGNAEIDLKQFPNNSFDYVVLSQTLQAFLNPMPVTKALPDEWYNTPNLHMCTIKDFVRFSNIMNFKIFKSIALNDKNMTKIDRSNLFFKNLFSELGIFLIEK